MYYTTLFTRFWLFGSFIPLDMKVCFRKGQFYLIYLNNNLQQISNQREKLIMVCCCISNKRYLEKRLYNNVSYDWAMRIKRKSTLSPRLHRGGGSVFLGLSQAQQHMTSQTSTSLIGGRLWRTWRA